MLTSKLFLYACEYYTEFLKSHHYKCYLVNKLTTPFFHIEKQTFGLSLISNRLIYIYKVIMTFGTPCINKQIA